MGKSQRTKGHGGERELRNLLADMLGGTVKRHLGQSRDGGADLELGDTWLIEVKRRARIAGVHEWMDQAQKAGNTTDKLAAIAFRGDGQEWIIGFTLRDAVNLWRESMPWPKKDVAWVAPSVPWEDVDD